MPPPTSHYSGALAPNALRRNNRNFRADSCTHCEACMLGPFTPKGRNSNGVGPNVARLLRLKSPRLHAFGHASSPRPANACLTKSSAQVRGCVADQPRSVALAPPACRRNPHFRQPDVAFFPADRSLLSKERYPALVIPPSFWATRARNSEGRFQNVVKTGDAGAHHLSANPIGGSANHGVIQRVFH